MISHRRSLRPWSAGLLICTLLLTASCGITTKRGSFADDETSDGSQKAATEADEYSIKEDRSHLSELRKEIPQETQKKNDELAVVLDLMKELKLHPSAIRSRFDRVVRKKRDRFNKKLRRERDAYNKDERKKRDAFLRDLKKKRAEFKKRDIKEKTREARNIFNQDYKEKRDDFFNDAKEKRIERESEWKIQRKEFYDYIKEKRNEFNDEMRSYNKRYYEYKDGKKLKQRMDKKAKRLERQKRMYSPGDMFNTSGRRQNNSSQQSAESYNSPSQPLQAGEEDGK